MGIDLEEGGCFGLGGFLIVSFFVFWFVICFDVLDEGGLFDIWRLFLGVVLVVLEEGVKLLYWVVLLLVCDRLFIIVGFKVIVLWFFVEVVVLLIL